MGSNASISATTFGVVVRTGGKFNSLGGDGEEGIVGATPASNTTLANADYGQTGSTRYATDITIASMTGDDSTYTTWTFNATGISNVSKTGVTNISMRLKKDIDNIAPTWASGVFEGINAYFADNAGTTVDPKMVVTYTIVIKKVVGGMLPLLHVG